MPIQKKLPLFFLIIFLITFFLGVLDFRMTQKKKEKEAYSECLEKVCREEEENGVLRNPDTECYSRKPLWLDSHTTCSDGIAVSRQMTLK